eukprot:14516879-Heterocapsa_arctica.AAC.1
MCIRDRIYARCMDYINSGLDCARGTEEFKLGISDKTGDEELIDMPDIINFMETGLREFKTENFRHKERGQHTGTVESWDDYEIMGDTEDFMEDWPRSPVPDYI